MNVLEHIEDDAEALRSLARVTLPGGRIVIWVPGYMQLYGDFDRKVGHVQRYTPKTLARTVAKAGLDVEVLKPINFLGGIAWWVAVRRGGVGYPDPRLVKIYDRTVVPLTRLIERFVRPPFGQTVFCVARVPQEKK
jgi:SAM-dependent methyltransferase